MARVALLCPDLLFGSKVEGALSAVGHEVARVGTVEDARTAAAGSDVLVVDLTDDRLDGASLGGLEGVPTLGFYAHVDQDTRRRAEAAGFDRVVPRSRMAREGAKLVGGLLGR
jgi:hypothetical protein